MKNLTVVIFLVLNVSFNSFSQQLRYSDFSTDKRLKGSYQSYVSKDGIVYNVGDTLKIGFPTLGKSFAFIYVENGFLEVGGGQAPKPLDAAARDIKLQIKNIWIRGDRRTGFYALIRSKGSAKLLPEIYSVELENAVEEGEIILPEIIIDKTLSDIKGGKE